MHGIVNYEVFLMAAILLSITPGTDTMYIISRSISQGRKAGIYSTLGITCGTIVHTLLAAFGLSVILMSSALVFNAIKIIGACYLGYLGVKMIVAKASSTENKASLPKQTNKKIFFQGLVTNVTNPKVALFFLAFIPQFIDTANGGSGPIPFLILGLTSCLTGAIWCLTIAIGASFTTKKFRENKTAESILNKLTGIVFIGMGVKLLSTKSNV
ncbi:LysE family translocator [Bacillus sp. CGMCC 1.16607]|uniref:LysE family translocator n=1 Tax=Bacillus sp. CGMCC 1.16607 TaxID=3351842 RepID=UPI00363DF874